MNNGSNGQEATLKQVYCPGCDAHRMVRFGPGESRKNCTYCGGELSRSRSTREKEKGGKRSSGSDEVEIRTLTCPSCGANLKVRNRRGAVAVVCDSCGSRLDPDEEEVIKERAGLDEEHSARIPLELGDTGTYRGAEMEVIGRLRYKDGIYTWDEWCLYSAEKGYWWFTEYKFHYHMYRPAKSTPDQSVRNLSWKDPVYLSGTTFYVYETGKAELIHVEGELPWKAETGDSVHYMDAVNPPHRLSAEWTEREMNIYVGDYVQPERAWEIFDLDGTPPEPRGDVASQPMPEWTRTWFVPSLAIVALFMLGWLCSYWFTNPEVVQAGGFKLEKIAKLTKNGEVYRTDPFELNEGGQIYRMEMISPDVDNSWTWVRVALLNDDDEIVYVLSDTLEYYHGTSGGESWSEGSNHTYGLFRLEESGSYRLAVQAERGGWRGGRPPDQLGVRLRKGAFASRYLFLGLIASVILPVVILFLKFRRHQKFWSD